MTNAGSVVVVGGTRAIGLELVKHMRRMARDVVLTGSNASTWPPPSRRPNGSAPGASAASTFDLAEPARRSAPAWPTSGRVRRLALVAIDRDAEYGRRLRHRPGDSPRDAEARRLHGRSFTRCWTA